VSNSRVHAVVVVIRTTVRSLAELVAFCALRRVVQTFIDGLGKLMSKFSRFFKMYSQYIMNHRENAKFLQ
jgi:hypothetical protein